MNGIKVRFTTPLDAPFLVKRHKRLIDSSSIFGLITSGLLVLSTFRSFQLFYKIYPRLAFKGFILEVNGKRVGLGLLQGSSGNTRMWYSIYLEEEWRHRGLGRELLRSMIKYSKALGVKTLMGVNSADNEAVIKLETSLNFKPVVIYMGLNLDEVKD